jgi:hypothetical protein
MPLPWLCKYVARNKNIVWLRAVYLFVCAGGALDCLCSETPTAGSVSSAAISFIDGKFAFAPFTSAEKEAGNGNFTALPGEL